MAKTGLKRLVYGTLDDPSKTGRIGLARTANVTFEKGDEKLYGDNGVAESDSGVTGGSIELETTSLTNQHKADLLGHTLTGSKLELKTTDIAPYTKLAFYRTETVNNKPKFVAFMYNKVQFGIPDEESQTKEGTTSFSGHSFSGTILQDENDSLGFVEEFDTEDEAIEAVDTFVGYTEPTGKMQTRTTKNDTKE